MNAVTGPSVEWLHKHAEARLCLGDALLDSCRENAGQQCVKTFSYRSRLPEPVDPTNLQCKVCSKCKPPRSFGGFSKIRVNDADATSLNPQSRLTMSGPDGVTSAITYSAIHVSIPVEMRTATIYCGRASSRST